MNITRDSLGVCREADRSRICCRSEQAAQDRQDSQEVSAFPELSLASPPRFCVLPVQMGPSLHQGPESAPDSFTKAEFYLL